MGLEVGDRRMFLSFPIHWRFVSPLPIACHSSLYLLFQYWEAGHMYASVKVTGGMLDLYDLQLGSREWMTMY